MTKIFTTDVEMMDKLFGAYDQNVRLVEQRYGIKISIDAQGLIFEGEQDKIDQAQILVEKLIELVQAGVVVDRLKVLQCADIIDEGDYDQILKLNNEVVAVAARGRRIYCKTRGQKKYVDAIKNNTVVLGIGPAGTGKTYLAVALAVAAFKANEVERIILTRPAIEAGEKLGFLPGDLQQKVDPYLRPLYDALQEMFGVDSYTKLIERGIIEIAPIAYMRGRTLARCFIILDEAQNTTQEQMKMFLTRLGENSKAVVNGDLTQIDLPLGKSSGLKQAAQILTGIEGIEIVTLTDKDVVRHELVKKIVKAYEQNTGR